MYATIRLPDDWNLEDVRDVLGKGFHTRPARFLQLTFLDTFDWRLAARGSRLWLESTSKGHVLHWARRPADPVYTLPIQRRPSRAEDLPDGHLRTELTPLLGIRALITVGSCRLRRNVAGVRDRHGDSTVHLYLENGKILGAAGTPAGTTLSMARIICVAGFERAFENAVRGLTSLEPDGEKDLDLLEIAAAEMGRSIGDYSSKIRLSLGPDQPSDTALRSILLDLLRTLVANVDGTVADLDEEFLHDLRVAARRTRTALTQIKGVLPKDRIAPFIKTIKWLGRATGPCRDLDVQLREIRRYQRAHPDLEEPPGPLMRAVGDARVQAHCDVCTALSSKRFSDLIRDWEAYLKGAAKGKRPPRATRPILETASERIFKAYRRMVKRGNRLDANPPAEAMHQIRIDAKDLRYLLEFFRSLYGKKKIDRLVDELKAFQDVLGGFNDLEVQQNRLLEFTRNLSSSRIVDSSTLAPAQQMAATLEERQEEYLCAFAGRFEAFASPKSQSRYRSLFGQGS